MANLVGIQYLRGIAALMVVALHASEMVPTQAFLFQFGHAGVDIFFVISGFIMAHSTHKFDPDLSRSIQATVFLRKRFVRVVPLYWIALLWTMKMKLVTGDVSLDLLKDLAFIPRFHVTNRIWPELIVGWTINYEVFFYVLFAVAMLFGAYRYLALFVSLTSFIFAGLLLQPISAPLVFYSSSLLIEFLMGIGVYAIFLRTYLVPRRILIVAIILAAGVLLLRNDDSPRVIALGVPSAIIVWASVLLMGGQHSEVKSTGALCRIGDASYSIYLFHLGVFSLMGHLQRRTGWEFNFIHPLIAVIVLVLIGACAGLVVFTLVERPLLKFLTLKLPHPRRM